MFTKRERFILAAWLLSWLIGPTLLAQARAGLFSTLVTTNTGASSLVVGGSAGGTTGTGGIKAGTVAAGTAISLNGAATGAVTSSVRNSTAGTGNYGLFQIGNDASAGLSSLYAFSSTFTPSGANFANGTLLQGNGAGGVTIQAQDAAGAIKFYTGGSTLAGGWSNAQHFQMSTPNIYDVNDNFVWGQVTGAARGYGLQAGPGGLGSYVVLFNGGGGATRPTCSSSERGALYFIASAPGTKDDVSVCAKDAANAYAWRAIY